MSVFCNVIKPQGLEPFQFSTKISSPSEEALEHQKSNGGKLGYNLVKLGFVKDEEIASLLSRQYGVPSINLSQFQIDAAVIKLVPAATVQKYEVVPVSRVGATLTIAMSDPTNVFAVDDIKFMTGYHVEPVVAAQTAILAAIDHYYGNGNGDGTGVEEQSLGEGQMELASKALEDLPQLDDDDVEVVEEMEEADVVTLERQGGEAPVVRLVNVVLASAIQKGASDIHIEPYEKAYRIRYRIDGTLYDVMSPPLKFRDAITSRLKIMAKLDIAEKRLPQDGRIKLRLNVGAGAKEIDFRVSCLPTLFGEKIVMRLLDQDKLMLDMTKLGFERESLANFEEAIDRPWGLVLVTGPTGSGKTNTLYSAIARINTTSTNIMTAEDPVEFNMTGVNQVQMRENIGLNFAAALRSFLRQDPNIILVGEIRDFETAEIAIKAALTDHLVLSTLHTNDAPSTVNRLMNMGIEPFLVASAVNLICAQRLVRCVCSDCSEEQPTPGAQSRGDRVHRRGRWHGRAAQGCRLREVQRHRLQGADRVVRGDAGGRRAERDDSDGGLDHRAAEQGDRARHADAAGQRAAQDRGGPDHDRGGPEGNGEVAGVPTRPTQGCKRCQRC